MLLSSVKAASHRLSWRDDRNYVFWAFLIKDDLVLFRIKDLSPSVRYTCFPFSRKNQLTDFFNHRPVLSNRLKYLWSRTKNLDRRILVLRIFGSAWTIWSCISSCVCLHIRHQILFRHGNSPRKVLSSRYRILLSCHYRLLVLIVFIDLLIKSVILHNSLMHIGYWSRLRVNLLSLHCCSFSSQRAFKDRRIHSHSHLYSA